MKRLITIIVVLVALACIFSARTADIQSFRGEQGLFLATEEYVRTFNVPSNWNTLRLGLRLTSSNMSGSNPGQFTIGFSSGTNGYTQSSPTHWIGVQLASGGSIKTNGSVLYWAADYGVGLGAIPLSLWMGKIVDGTVTLATNFSRNSAGANWYIAGSNNSNKTAAIYFDITKGSTWGVKTWMMSSTVDITSGHHETNMTAASPIMSFPSTYFYYGQAGLPVDEAVDGYFDTVNVWWSLTNKFLRIHDIQVSRIN